MKLKTLIAAIGLLMTTLMFAQGYPMQLVELPVGSGFS